MKPVKWREAMFGSAVVSLTSLFTIIWIHLSNWDRVPLKRYCGVKVTHAVWALFVAMTGHSWTQLAYGLTDSSIFAIVQSVLASRHVCDQETSSLEGVFYWVSWCGRPWVTFTPKCPFKPAVDVPFLAVIHFDLNWLLLKWGQMVL